MPMDIDSRRRRRSELKQYLGSILWSILGVGLAGGAIVGWHWALWTLAPIALVFLAGAFLLWPATPTVGKPLSPPLPQRDSAFIRGDASGSYFENLDVEGASAVVDGDARGAVFRNIRYRAARVKRLFNG